MFLIARCTQSDPSSKFYPLRVRAATKRATYILSLNVFFNFTQIGIDCRAIRENEPVKQIFCMLLLCGMAAAQISLATKQDDFKDPCSSMTMGPACGHIDGNLYENEYFGFSYTFPSAWKALDQKIILRVHQQKFEEKRANAFRQAKGKPVLVLDSWDLVVASKLGLPPSNPKPFNSNLVLWVDEISADQRTPADLLQTSGFTQENGSKLLSPISTLNAGGRQFARADRLDQEDGRNIYHTRAVTFIRNYALGFDCYSDNRQELEKMFQTLQTLKFKTQPDTGTLSGASYHNAYFGFSYQVPATLTPLNEYQMRQVAWEQHKDNIASMPSGPNVTLLFFPNYDLLAAYSVPVSNDVKVNSWLRVWAERNPLTRQPEDYFYNSSFLMEEHISGRKMPAKVILDGRNFVRADRWNKVSGHMVYMSRIATVDKDLTLVFEFGCSSQKELDDLLQSLASIKFDRSQSATNK
jgi:hypothetical protein